MSNDEKDRELALLRGRRNKAAEWHRRMQQAESACAAALAGKPRAGSMSIGRALANAGAGHWRDRAEAAEAQRDALAALLLRARRYVEQDAQMMADITRHAPLDPESQAAHDATEYESERLLSDIAAALAKEPKHG
jgi:hypothetical protein